MRIPVLFGDVQAEKDDVYLAEGNAEPVLSGYAERFTLPAAQFGHVIGCNCCTPRGPAADALSRLFRARATGAAPFFKRVIVRAAPPSPTTCSPPPATACRINLYGGVLFRTPSYAGWNNPEDDAYDAQNLPAFPTNEEKF